MAVLAALVDTRMFIIEDHLFTLELSNAGECLGQQHSFPT